MRPVSTRSVRLVRPAPRLATCIFFLFPSSSADFGLNLTKNAGCPPSFFKSSFCQLTRPCSSSAEQLLDQLYYLVSAEEKWEGGTQAASAFLLGHHRGFSEDERSSSSHSPLPCLSFFVASRFYYSLSISSKTIILAYFVFRPFLSSSLFCFIFLISSICRVSHFFCFSLFLFNT
jgi:hypothetical protein